MVLETVQMKKNIMTHSEAVLDSDLIIIAIPGTEVISTLENIGNEKLENKIILDVSNAFTPEFALAYPNDSVASQIQDSFPKSKVVKSLNTMNVSVMTNPDSVKPQSTVFLSGNDNESKKIVKGLLADLGWKSESMFDLGDINTAAGPEHYGLLFFGLLAALETPSFNIAVSK